jgi:hypothetical protein
VWVWLLLGWLIIVVHQPGVETGGRSKLNIFIIALLRVRGGFALGILDLCEHGSSLLLNLDGLDLLDFTN